MDFSTIAGMAGRSCGSARDPNCIKVGNFERLSAEAIAEDGLAEAIGGESRATADISQRADGGRTPAQG